MTASSLLRELESSEVWSPALTLARREEDGSALEIMYPLVCPNGSFAWRRSAAVIVPETDEEEIVKLPELFYDYLDEWNTSHIAVLSDQPYGEAIQHLEQKPRVVLVDLSAEPYASASDADILEGTIEYLHPNITGPIINDILDGMATHNGPCDVSDFDLCCEAVENMHWVITHLFRACVAPHTDHPGSIEIRDNLYIHGLKDHEHHIHINIAHLSRLFLLYANLADRSRTAVSDREFWASFAQHGRAMAELAFRLQHARGLSDAFSNILRQTEVLHHPIFQHILAADLSRTGIKRLQSMLSGIRFLGLNDDIVIDALLDIAVSSARIPSEMAVRTLGDLRATRARQTIEEMTHDHRKSTREMAEVALALIDNADKSTGLSEQNIVLVTEDTLASRDSSGEGTESPDAALIVLDLSEGSYSA